jgi:hypothetical protein
MLTDVGELSTRAGRNPTENPFRRLPRRVRLELLLIGEPDTLGIAGVGDLSPPDRIVAAVLVRAAKVGLLSHLGDPTHTKQNTV